MTPTSVLSTTRSSSARRVWEWIWRTQALRAAQRRQTELSYVLACDQRARIALEVGERTLDPTSPWAAGSASHLAAASFVESIGWSLRVASNAAASPATNELRPPQRAELVELISEQRRLLLEAAGDPDVLSRALENLVERRFEARAPSAAEPEHEAHELGKVARALQHAVAPREEDLDTLSFQRFVRAGLVVVSAVACVLGVTTLRDSIERRGDLAAGKAWTASSSYLTVCLSPSHSCEAGSSYFFHTREEENPWLEIDLRDAQAVSKVHVFNRRDCCAERAVPLVVEVSTDHATWREVARETESFAEWTAHFSPIRARWIRLRVARRSLLHLADVRVLK